MVTSSLDGTAANFSKTEHLGHDDRCRSAEEFVQVVKGLWDSWGSDYEGSTFRENLGIDVPENRYASKGRA